MNDLSYYLKSAVVFLIVFFSIFADAVNFPSPPAPFHYVNDYTDTLSVQEKSALENKLMRFSQETSSQIAVVLIPSTEGYDISQYTFELGDKWGIGRKQHNNGVLMLIAKNDHKIFIAVGQGLEGALPDALLSQTIRQAITPYFKQERYAQGIDSGLDQIIAAAKGEFLPEQQSESEFLPVLLLAIFLLIMIFGEINWRNQPYISPTNHRSGRIIRDIRRNDDHFGGFGGGFGGRSSGGGFGGGGFGGGGAGGSW